MNHGDFKISWDDVVYYDTAIIPAGEINFSKIARNNEAIGYVKETLNIVLSGFMALNILKYIYNLLLTTLGIDNPMIVEAPDQPVTTVTKTETIKTTNGKLTQTTRYKGGK